MAPRTTNTIKLLLGLLIVFVVVTASCKHDAPLNISKILVSESEISYQDQVQPILTSNCGMSGCHDAGSAKEGLDVSSYSSLAQSDDKMMVPGNPAKSKLYKVLQSSGEERMPPPPRNAVPANQQEIIRLWIEQGARNTYWANPCDTSKFGYANSVKNIIDSYCIGCHSTGNPSGGGVDLSSISAIQPYVANGKFLGSVRQDGSASNMPKGGSKMPDCKIKILEKWVQNNLPQ